MSVSAPRSGLKRIGLALTAIVVAACTADVPVVTPLPSAAESESPSAAPSLPASPSAVVRTNEPPACVDASFVGIMDYMPGM